MEMDIRKVAGGGAVGTLLLGIAGYYYNAHSKCMEEANSAMTEYANLRTELGNRLIFLAEAVDKSPSIAELGKQIAPARYFLSTYKDKTTRELLHMENAVELKFYPFSSIQLQLSQTLEPKSRYILDSLLSGTIPLHVSDKDRQNIEDIIIKFKDALVAQGNVTLYPRCDIAQTVPIIFGYKPEIVDKLPMNSPNP